MGSVTDHLSDTSIIGDILAYLYSEHRLLGLVVDSDNNTVLGDDTLSEGLDSVRDYKFDYMEDIGGVRFHVESDEALDKAVPHMDMCLSVINQLLEKETILSQSMEEILELSGQLHFLKSLGSQLKGISEVEKFCTIVLSETVGRVKANSGFTKITGGAKKGTTVTHNISVQEADSIEQQAISLSNDTIGTKILSLEDGRSLLWSVVEKQDGCKGCIGFIRDPNSNVFTNYEKQLVTISDSIVSPTIESLELYESLQGLYINTVKALAAAIDAKDEYTHGHSFRVALYAVAIGKKMGIDEASLKSLEVAAYMHDLGKIGISERVLSKPGRLTDEEFQEIKAHPDLTNKILKPINLPSAIVDAAVQHHERLDGRGYPYGLQGDMISPFAKIIAVADVFDALTSKRPYRDAMPVENALTILCKGINTEFDRNAVLALLSALRDDDEGTISGQADLEFVNVKLVNQLLEKLIETLVDTQSCSEQADAKLAQVRAVSMKSGFGPNKEVDL